MWNTSNILQQHQKFLVGFLKQNNILLYTRSIYHTQKVYKHRIFFGEFYNADHKNAQLFFRPLLWTYLIALHSCDWIFSEQFVQAFY